MPVTASTSSPGLGKVLHFISWGGRSGAERLVLNLCKATRNLEPAVWFPREGPIVEEFVRAGVRCLETHDVLGRPGEIRSDFALMHIHCGVYEPVAHRAAARLKIPSLTTLHSHLALPELECPLVCVSSHTAAIQDARNRVRVIPNAVDTIEFAPAVRRNSERVVIMRVCRPDRCAPWFMDAMRLVLEKHTNAELWIVGETGPSAGRVRYLGTRSDVPALLREADLFAYAPFPYQGSHDLCVLEAMATGLPCVLTDVPTVRGSVRSLQEGILVPFGDIDGFAAAVGRLTEDRALRFSLARQARIRAEQEFSLARLASDYMAAYSDAINAPPPEPADAIRRNMRSFVAGRMRLSEFERNLVLLHETLAATAIGDRYWVIGGLLIGWAREGQVLAHDCQDGDFGVFAEDCEKLLQSIPSLLAAGFQPFAKYIDNRGIPVEYSFHKDGARFDFFLHEKVGDSIRCTFFGLSADKDPQPIELISEVPSYSLAAMEFLGRTWRKPADHDAFLTAQYGNWRTQRAFFDHRSDNCSILQINWRDDASNAQS